MKSAPSLETKQTSMSVCQDFTPSAAETDRTPQTMSHTPERLCDKAQATTSAGLSAVASSSAPTFRSHSRAKVEVHLKYNGPSERSPAKEENNFTSKSQAPRRKRAEQKKSSSTPTSTLALASPFSAEVVVPGLPRGLFYSIPHPLIPIDIDKEQNTSTEIEAASQCGVGSEVLIPVGRGIRQGWVVRILPTSEATEILALLRKEGEPEGTTKDEPSAGTPQQTQLSLLAEAPSAPKERLSERAISLKSIIASTPAFLPEQLPLFEWISSYYGYSLADVIDSAVPLRDLKKKRRRAKDPLHQGASLPPPLRALTAGQQTAVKTIGTACERREFAPFLLYGVTGSGKTEVYMRLIEQVLEAGGNALVVVPEIALTPQLLDQFAARLKVPLALLHSQVETGARRNTWDKLIQGEARVAIGARSAVFAPLQNLSLIVVDEEHESSYKQSDGLRYHARDVAVVRAKLSNCTVVLGSATPSFETLLNVQRKRYSVVEIPDRVTSRPLPAIEIIDLSQVRKSEMVSTNIAPPLFEAMRETLGKKEQVILLYNRRGFSSYLQCETCNEVVMCPDCSLALTYHKTKERLKCHYCDLSRPVPAHCERCRDPRMTRVELSTEGAPLAEESELARVGLLAHRGGGTERVVEEIQGLFPDARIARMDRDTVQRKDSYREILGSMRSGAADILVGTQMIAKGHDLPGVTLVGIINADVGLHMPDFRSSEKTFQLITQAAGRAGRGEVQGRVLVQTREPNHPTIVATASGRFKAFARYELDFRKQLEYPPYGKLLRIIVSSEDRGDLGTALRLVEGALRHLVDRATEHSAAQGVTLRVLGPAVAPYEKLRSRYRAHFLVKSNTARVLSWIALTLRNWRQSTPSKPEFRIALDLDPVDMM